MHLVHIKLCVSQKNVSDSTVYSTISLTNLPAGGIAGVQEIILSFVGGSIMVKDIEAMGCCAVSKWKVQDLCNKRTRRHQSCKVSTTRSPGCGIKIFLLNYMALNSLEPFIIITNRCIKSVLLKLNCAVVSQRWRLLRRRRWAGCVPPHSTRLSWKQVKLTTQSR